MNRTLKLVLDIAMGAVIPILILSYLSPVLGNITAYVVASLVPVSWVFIDLLFISRRFNFITSYTGLFAVVNGLLTFWFVDGLLYAIKDSAGFVLSILIFAGSVVVGRPILHYFVVQGLAPDTPEQSKLLHSIMHEPPIYRAAVWGCLLFAGINVVTGAINFALNINIVTAGFGTELFNQQVARVNAITRFLLNIPEALGIIAAVWMLIYAIYSTIYKQLPQPPAQDQGEHDIWELLQLREAQRAGGEGGSEAPAAGG